MFTKSKIDRSKFESIIVFNIENNENKNIRKKNSNIWNAHEISNKYSHSFRRVIAFIIIEFFLFSFYVEKLCNSFELSHARNISWKKKIVFYTTFRCKKLWQKEQTTYLNKKKYHQSSIWNKLIQSELYSLS